MTPAPRSRLLSPARPRHPRRSAPAGPRPVGLRSLRSLRALLVGCALVAASCGVFGDDEAGSDGNDRDGTAVDNGGDGTAAGDGDGDGDGATDAGPVEGVSFTEGDCGFEVPSGATPRCGVVEVPENWETGEGTVALAVAVFESTADDPAPDPVVYLEGGPGGHALETVRFVSSDLLEPLQERGDVVFFDQRGVGLTEPRLDCGEITVLNRELEDDPAISDEEVDRRFAEVLTACRDRLEGEGIDLAAYTTAANARDVEAIRVALGYDQWNLLGISYGTRLGLEVLRSYPEGVRSAILDSVFPPDVDSTRDTPGGFLDAWDAVVAACAEESACQAGGDLDQRMEAIVADYEQDPIEVEVQNFLTGESDTVTVEGDALVGLVTQALYSPEQFTDLPELAAELEARETAALELFLSQQRTNEAFFSAGMFYAVECNEEIPFADEAEVASALPGDPFGLNEQFNYASNTGTNAFTTCAAFDPGADPDPAANEPVTSDVPTLLLAGRFDPVTPVAWAERAAATLAGSHVVVAPARSHGISPGRCGMDVVRQFLDDPGQAPDASCFDDEKLRFLTAPDTGEIALEEVTYPGIDPSLTVSTVRPRDWVHTDLDGDSFRQASFLDPTELIQLAGNELLAANLEMFLVETQGVTFDEPRTVERGGRTWVTTSGRNETRVVEWYETEINGHVALVILVATEAERDALVAAVLEPALDSIDVTG